MRTLKPSKIETLQAGDVVKLLLEEGLGASRYEVVEVNKGAKTVSLRMELNRFIIPNVNVRCILVQESSLIGA